MHFHVFSMELVGIRFSTREPLSALRRHDLSPASPASRMFFCPVPPFVRQPMYAHLVLFWLFWGKFHSVSHLGQMTLMFFAFPQAFVFGVYDSVSPSPTVLPDIYSFSVASSISSLYSYGPRVSHAASLVNPPIHFRMSSDPLSAHCMGRDMNMAYRLPFESALLPSGLHMAMELTRSVRMPLLASWCTLRCVITYVEGGRVGMYRSPLDGSHLS
jgi:hypothetical protein